MDTYNYLLDKYGPLLSINQLANVLGRSTNGLRVALYSENDFANSINSTKCRYGRRLFFKTEAIASFIDNMEVGGA